MIICLKISFDDEILEGRTVFSIILLNSRIVSLCSVFFLFRVFHVKISSDIFAKSYVIDLFFASP